MNKCDCWHKEERIVGWCGFSPLTKTVYECYGTKEREECQCMGDRGKCDFYPEVREKAMNGSQDCAKKMTNSDTLRAMGDEELAEFLNTMFQNHNGYRITNKKYDIKEDTNCLLNWLKAEYK